MFPLDLILLSNVVKWIARKMYFKIFATEYSPIEDILEDGHGTTCGKDVYYTGTVTEIRGDVAFVDGRYTFSTSQMDRDVFIGNIVTCVINSNKRYGMLSDLTIIDILNDYDDNLEVTPISNSKAHGVIVKRQDRIFTVSPGPLEFDLDRVTTKFIPEVGDLVKLLVEKDEEDETRVVQIFPRGYKVITGTITSYENDAGFINDTVVFQKHHCQPMYQPQKDDRVVMSVIRCQNGSTQFRALHVTPLVDNRKTKNDHLLIPPQSFFSNLIFNPQEVICVNLEESKIVEAELYNNSDTKYNLMKLKAYTTESLIELVEPTDIVLSIEPKSKAQFKFKVSLKYVGFCSITFDFEFEGFTFTSSLNLLAIDKTNDLIVAQLEVDKKDSSMNLSKRSDSYESKSLFPPRCTKPGRHFRVPIKFFPVKLGLYVLPDELVRIMKDGHQNTSVKTELIANYPCLSSQLKQENYKIYMHCLLYLEEISQLEKVSKLELTCGFEKRNDFLILNIDEGSNFTMLQAGDRVVARKPWDSEGDVFEGIIWQAHHKELFIKFDRKFHDNYVNRSEYILNFSLSRSQMRLKHQAVDDIMYILGTRWLFPNQTTFSPPLIIRVEDESEESSSISNFNSQRRNTKWNRQGAGYGNQQQRYIWESIIPLKRKRIIKWFNGDLNAEQKSAVVNCLRAESRPFPYIIFGPPGTGKSMTLIELCLQIYKLIPESRTLLVAPSNSAADQLSLNLIASGFVEEIDFVRLGGFRYIESGNMPDGLVKYVYLPVLNDDNNSEQDDTNKINRYCLSEKRIIVSTLGSIGTLKSMGFPNGYFSHYIVDEAGQIMEPENLIIASLMSNDSQIILAGDPLQLGPVVYSSLAKRYGLHRSYLLRLMDFKPYMFDKLGFLESYGYNPKYITKLVRSYRSLPKLLELTSNLFYRGELKAMVNESDSREAAIYFKLMEIFPVGSEIPILFHSVAGREVLDDGSFSFYNNEEVFQICTYLSQLYRLGMESHNIGIITPYVAQVRKIVQFLDSLSQEVPKIGSVEEFQGQEKDIILLSTVRSSVIVDPNVNQMTFVYSPQRINVALSRAKSVLIIVGNSTTLSNDEVWKNVVEYTIKHKSFRR